VSFKVEFDPERTLKPSNYSLVTPVQLLFYDDYLENSQGILLSKGRYFSSLDKVAFNIELPGEDLSRFWLNFKNTSSGKFLIWITFLILQTMSTLHQTNISFELLDFNHLMKQPFFFIVFAQILPS